MATIEKINLSLEDIKSAIDTQKSPIDIANNIKSFASSEGNTLDTTQMLISALGTLETFASAISKYETSIPGTTLSSASLLLNIAKANNEIKSPDKGGYGNVTNGTLNSIIADLSSLTSNVGLAIKNPYIVAVGLSVSTTFSVAAFLSTDGDTSIATSIVSAYKTVSSIGDNLISYANENNISIDSLISESLSMFEKTPEPTVLDPIEVIANKYEYDDLTIYGDQNNPDKITFTDENGDYQVWEKDSEGNFVQTNKVDYSGTLNTAINQIGSLIIMNNQDFSNVEKIVVSTSVATIADFATYKGTAEFNTTNEIVSNLKGAVVSFAVSSFFAKNDNIADILGMDGTFVGGLADFSVSAGLGYSLGMYIASDFNVATTLGNMSLPVGTTGLTSFQFMSAGAIGGYLGSTLANEIMNWDTKEEAMGAAVGSAIGAGAVMAILMASGPIGWVGAVLYTFGGSFIGNIVGGIIGGLFGKKTPPPPTAKANYEFDEETESYNLISSSSSNGGNKQAMINIGKAFANHLENMFNLPGGQLIDSDFLPNIKVNQVKDTVTINGQSGSFDDVNQIMADLLVNHIPFINVENGDEYILRALNRTNESFQEGNPNSTKGRGNLEEYNFIFQKSMNNTNYKNNKILNKVS